jgi:hypothetical protein
MKYRLYKYQRRFLQGLILATILSLINSILVIKFELYGGKNHGFAILFPFIIYFIVYFSFVIYNWACFIPYNKWLGVDSKYVEQNYPEIWKRIAPHHTLWGSWYSRGFIRGRYDDGKDERLNRIKHEMKATENIFGGGALLLVLVEVISLILHFSKMACFR